MEDWSRIPLDTGVAQEGIAILTEGGHNVLHLKSTGDTSGVIRDIRSRVDLTKTPIVEWSWRVVRLPRASPASAIRAAERIDERSVQFQIVWLRSSNLLNSRGIAYVWDSVEPEGTVKLISPRAPNSGH